MRNDITENDYLDMLESIEMTNEMQSVIDDVLELVDSRMMALKPSERAMVGIKLATIMGTNTLANALRNHRHLLNAATEALASDITDYTEAAFTMLDNDEATNETKH